MSYDVSFTVPGVPVGKGRPKFARRGNFVTAYTPEKTANYENLVKYAAAKAMTGIPLFEGPVDCQISIEVTPPESWSAKKKALALAGGLLPTTKPDLDNVVKGLFDAMNDVVWKDDKQVTALFVTKGYAALAKVTVEVKEDS